MLKNSRFPSSFSSKYKKAIFIINNLLQHTIFKKILRKILISFCRNFTKFNPLNHQNHLFYDLYNTKPKFKLSSSPKKN